MYAGCHRPYPAADMQVFMFIVNDKGTSWAYATPGFGSSLNPELLKELRVLAQVPEQAKLVTEMMPDPPNAKTVDTTGNPGLTVVRGADQVPGSIAVCTRAQSTMPTRSRSSCSGGSAGEASGAGDAPINQGQTVMQVGILSTCAHVDSSNLIHPWQLMCKCTLQCFDTSDTGGTMSMPVADKPAHCLDSPACSGTCTSYPCHHCSVHTDLCQVTTSLTCLCCRVMSGLPQGYVHGHRPAVQLAQGALCH